MKIVDPFDNLQSDSARDAAAQLALRSEAAVYIQHMIGDQLAELEDNDDLEHPFTRGYRMGLRVAYLAAGGECDGSEESWAQIVEAHREP